MQLTPREYDLLTAFLDHPQQALSREQLSQLVWGTASRESPTSSMSPSWICGASWRRTAGRGVVQTVRGYGYALREE